LLLLLSLAPAPGWAATVSTEIEGIEGELLANVRASVSLVAAEDLDDLALWRLRSMAEDARAEIEQALRPFGYYRPAIEVRLIEPEDDSRRWQARLTIEAGSPVRIDETVIELRGDGRDDPELAQWRQEWPLAAGDRLDHTAWEAAWRRVEQLAEERGYFRARFEERRVIVDADRQEADIRIVFDTGPRYRFGEYRAEDQPFSPSLMDRLHILDADEPYSVERLDRQREALVRSGLFERVVVDTTRDADQERVDLDYRLDPRPPNTWRATVGFGTDTGARMQLGWTRHYLGSRGNRLEAALGAQQNNREYVFQAEYRHPRGDEPSEFWTAGTTLRSERDDFRFYEQDRIEPVFDSFDGRREQTELTFGRLQQRTLWPDRYEGLEERLFVSILNESFDAFREGTFSPENEALLQANPELRSYLDTDSRVVAFGGRWRLPNISGSGFNTRGSVWRAHLIGAHESAGSEVSFAQAWLSGRMHLLLGNRHKLLVRGEVGYTEADTRRLDIRLGDRSLDLTLTELPERYRFKTGGDRTVRGYGFEELSTNRNGANHLLVGSVEYEYRVGENWSLAAFADIGNAFNDLDQRKLKRGVGVGFRWYTMIGPLRIDIAQALDDVDEPWRLHFTIGTQLL
jgi:translocation and assembly module TamA